MINYILDDKQEIKLLNTKEDIIFSNYLSFTLDVSNKTVHGIINQLIYNDQFKQDIDKSMNLLSERTQKILRLRYGLDDGVKRTRAQIGEVFNVKGDRIRTLEEAGIRYIRKSNRIKYIEKYTTVYKNVENNLYEELLIRNLENYLFDADEGMLNKFLNNIGVEIIVKKSQFFNVNKKKGLQLENKSLEELGLDLRLMMCLKRAGYTCLLDILPLKGNHEELLKIRNIGKMAAQRLIDWLNDYETNMLDLYSDTETISISLKNATSIEHFNFFNINTYKIATVIIDYLKEHYDLILDDDIDELEKVIAFKNGYITKELFEKNKQNITNVKNSYLHSHPLQEQEKMIESYVLFGRCTYQDSNEKTVSLLKKAFILSEGSVQDYYKSIERLVHYEKKNDFCSTSKYILRDINSR